jgi:hypothetical protein
MKLNLEALKNSVTEHLDREGFAVFQGICHSDGSRPMAYWDTGRNPDFHAFLAIAVRAGVKLVVFNHVEFSAAMVEDAMGRLGGCDLPVEERRGFERRLKEMQAYDGFSCALELSFDSGGRTYVFEVRTDWYTDFLRVSDEIDVYAPEDEERGDGDSMGGYYSRN